MAHKILLSLILSVVTIAISAQSDTSSMSLNQPKRTSISVSYFAESITNPGYKLGFEHEFWVKSGSRIKKNGQKLYKKHVLLVSGNLLSYSHYRNHTGVLINSELGYRYIRKNGFMYEASFGVGYLHTFLNGNTYTVTDNNEVKKVPLAGQSNFSYSYSVGIGKDYSFKNGKQWAWHMKYVSFSQYPYGAGSLNHMALEFGIVYFLK